MMRGGLGFENRERKDEHHTHIPALLHYLYLTTDTKFLVCLAPHNCLATARYTVNREIFVVEKFS